jgi:hypothetical protein
MMIRRSAFVLILFLWLAGCSEQSMPGGPSTPTVTSFAGTWVGDLTLQTTTARMTWTLTQSGTAATGPVIVALPNGIVLLNGTLNGTIAGSTLTYTISVQPGGIPSQPSCSGQLGGTVAESSSTSPVTLSGSYSVASSTCTTPFSSGTFTLTRQ